MKGRYIFGRAAIAAAVLLWIINALMWYTGSDNGQKFPTFMYEAVLHVGSSYKLPVLH